MPELTASIQDKGVFFFHTSAEKFDFMKGFIAWFLFFHFFFILSLHFHWHQLFFLCIWCGFFIRSRDNAVLIVHVLYIRERASTLLSRKAIFNCLTLISGKEQVARSAILSNRKLYILSLREWSVSSCFYSWSIVSWVRGYYLQMASYLHHCPILPVGSFSNQNLRGCLH